MAKHDFSKLHLIERNREWLTADFGWGEKLAYYPALVAAFFRLLAGRKSVRYFGQPFMYDNLASPLNMQNYPYEITHKILRNTDGKIRTALDIGGNIGQFPVTLEHICASVKHIDALEPNPAIFEMLEANTAYSKKINVYNYAVAKGSNLTFYYEEGRSAIGSFIKENASDTGGTLQEIKVQTTTDIPELTGRKLYDLITIDVEGYEYELLGVLRDLGTRYLYLEASGAGRTKGYDHSKLLERVAKTFGDFDIVYQSELIGRMNTIEYLFKFKA